MLKRAQGAVELRLGLAQPSPFPRSMPEHRRNKGNEMMTVDTQRLVKALRLHKAWSDSDKTGPDYGGQTRGTHPDGEKIWRIWWDSQLSLCGRAVAATDEALAYFDAMTASANAGVIRRNIGE